MAGGVYRRKPNTVMALQFNGGIDLGDKMIEWVQRQGRKQSLSYDPKDSHLLLSGPKGTDDLFLGWWLIWENEEFFVLTDVEFQETYEKLEV